MTHEADTTNFSMSLVDDAAEAAFMAAANKMPRGSAHSLSRGASSRTEREIRMSFGRWSLGDKLEWECQSCTFLNQPLFLSCEMCGQARPAHEGPPHPGGTVVTTTTSAPVEEESPLSLEERREMAIQEEEDRIKQERIKEIMALQQGIFNKIREENEEVEEQSQEDLESSFAWMDLEDTLPISELPASRVSMNGYVGKKPTDASNSTLSTAATSYSQLSSVGQFSQSQNWLDSSSYHSHSDRRVMDSSISQSNRQVMDNSSSSYHSTRLMDGSSYHSARMDTSANSTGHRLSTSSSHRNEAIPAPEQSHASLRGDSARSSYIRGTVHKSTAHSNSSHPSRNTARGAGGALADFNALKAAVEGVSVRSFVLEDTDNRASLISGASNHSAASSYNLLGGSNHSLGSNIEIETPDKCRRRAALNSSIPSLQSYGTDDVQELQDSDSDDEDEKPVAETKRRTSSSSVVGALAVSGKHPALLKAAKDVLKYEGPPVKNPMPRPVRSAEPTHHTEDPASPGAREVTGRPSLKMAKEQLFNEPTAENQPMRSPFSRFSSPPAGAVYPTGMPQQPQDASETGDKRSNLSRLDGARKISTPSIIPVSKKMNLSSANDPVFQRNLYADRKPDSRVRSSSPKQKEKGVKSIPIFNRMLRKKGSTANTGSPKK
ncbi:expressed unknown protein [Seminavis robusta]|uniref:RanBP2-type domain-containing protein n=1 Tax=Seminavis robusta TaxID=568900 RepID=A0A9N8DRN5_9STRA|nr:expressed unknown protein [Seminavis robusta]|eukprot:Sro233_g094190.1 n/a (662) ;mRNA; f:37114-39099